jgi:hypothetical protein
MKLSRTIAKAKVHPLLFMGLLMLIFLAPSVVTAFSGGKIPAPQLPSHSFPTIKR